MLTSQARQTDTLGSDEKQARITEDKDCLFVPLATQICSQVGRAASRIDQDLRTSSFDNLLLSNKSPTPQHSSIHSVLVPSQNERSKC